MEEVKAKLKRLLSLLQIPLPVIWLLADEPQEDEEIDPKCKIEEYIYSDECVNADPASRLQFLMSKIGMSEEEIAEVALKTIGQYNNVFYCRYKNYRLSASNFGIVLKAISISSYPESLFKRLLGLYNAEKVSCNYYHDRKIPKISNN